MTTSRSSVRPSPATASLVLGVAMVSLSTVRAAEPVTLPPPALDGEVSVEAAVAARRSVREYAPSALALARVGQILWAAQGVTTPDGRRAAPSAGALYPLEVYLVAGRVEGLPPGLYRYEPRGHRLLPAADGDLRERLAAAAVGQTWIARAPAVLVVTAVHRRTARKYGDRARRYVAIEVGHVGQNVYLQATAAGLATAMVGALDDEAVRRLLDLPPDHAPMAIMPIGEPR